MTPTQQFALVVLCLALLFGHLQLAKLLARAFVTYRLWRDKGLAYSLPRAWRHSARHF